MLITSDFIFVHIPKTGGTFINEIVQRLYKPKRFSRVYRWMTKWGLWHRSCKLIISELKYPNLDDYPRGVHCGLRHIPKTTKPIMHVKRNPEDFYKSLFFYGHYKKVPHLTQEILDNEFEDFPNLKPDELFKYYHLLSAKIVGIDQLKFGYLTLELIEELSPSEEIREKLISLLQKGKINEAVETLKNANKNMHILDISSLNKDLEQFLRKHTRLSGLKSLSSIGKINVSKKSKVVHSEFLSDQDWRFEEFAYKYWGYNRL
jgi:hypothetical protein